MRGQLSSYALIQDMIYKMDLNEHKGGWHNLTHEQLLILLHQEMLELSKAIFTGESPRAIGYEAADVACFAMMIADNAGAYKDRPHARKRIMNQSPGTSTPTKPVVSYVASPNQSARGGDTSIKRIILHYTTASTMSSTVSWFQTTASRVSAHYIVGKNGEIVQMVRDGAKAWHAGGENNNSIGIEHVAAKGDKLTDAQSKASAELIRWLLAEYKLTIANVTGHRFTAAGHATRTDCPGDLWATEDELKSWLLTNVSRDTKPINTGRPYVPCPLPLTWHGNLVNGCYGSAVYELQCALIGLGYLARSTELVGDVFNDHVEYAVKQLQGDAQHIQIDGIVGAATRARITSLLVEARVLKTPAPTSGKPVRCEFRMDLERTSALRAGTLSFFDANNTLVRKEPATSGLPGYQSTNDVWTRGAGPVPSVPNQAIRFSDGYRLTTRGIEGWAFPMLPDPIMRNGSVGRSEIMLHRDANVPGTAGCIGLLVGRDDYDEFVKWAKNLGTLPLKVVYT